MACDYFIDALDEPNFALKVRERLPGDLDSALRIALQLEVWTKDRQSSRSTMGNLVSHSADQPDNRRAPTSTAEFPTERDNDAAPAQGARPNQDHVTQH